MNGRSATSVGVVADLVLTDDRTEENPAAGAASATKALQGIMRELLNFMAA